MSSAVPSHPTLISLQFSEENITISAQDTPVVNVDLSAYPQYWLTFEHLRKQADPTTHSFKFLALINPLATSFETLELNLEPQGIQVLA